MNSHVGKTSNLETAQPGSLSLKDAKVSSRVGKTAIPQSPKTLDENRPAFDPEQSGAPPRPNRLPFSEEELRASSKTSIS